MGAGRKTQTVHVSDNYAVPTSAAPSINSSYAGFRNLQKSDLAGIIFGCKHNTMKECLTKQLFGLPGMHYSYIRNIEPGLPLFLFNYSDRRMHGIFEAAGPGQMNIDPYAWSDDGYIKTPFPAQVRIFTKTPCLALKEEQFKKVIEDNYYETGKFWFALDRAQTRNLISLFKPDNPGYAPLSVPLSVNLPPTTLANAQPNISYKQTLLGLNGHLNLSNHPSSTTSYREVKDNCEMQDSWADQVEWEENYNNNAESGFGSTEFGVGSESGLDEQTVLNKLTALALEREELNGCASQNVANENNELTQVVKELVVQTTEMLKRQVESDKEVGRLNNILNQSGRKIFQLESRLEELELRFGTSAQYAAQSEKLIYLVGGFDSSHCLSSFDVFLPSKDVLMPLKRMSSARAYTSVAALGEGIFVFGGGDGNSWSDMVEHYNRSTNEWVQWPPLSCPKGSIAGVTLGGKIFAIGGGDAYNSSSCVEILNPSLGKWVFGESLNEKRFAPAAAELNGAIYTVGGYDGKYYLGSAERYDPREGYWTQLPSMTERRGSLSLAVINEKLYAVGGFDGRKMVSTVEIFDPRFLSWIPGVPMRQPRAYAASAVINDTLYMMGGLSNDDTVEIVECFNQNTCWYAPGFKSIGGRSFFSAVVM